MSQFVLKLIAAITMFIDHTGVVLFPQNELFRIIGRLAFPIYSYCIAEGFRFTRNRLKYFLRIFILGVVCQVVYTITERQIYLGILITFSISIVIMYLAECVKTAFANKKSHICGIAEKIMGTELKNSSDRVLSSAIFLISVSGAFLLCMYVDVDYGFFGIMLPVFTNMFSDRKRRLFMFSASLIALCIDVVYGGFTVQFWSLAAVPIIAAYNGKLGKYKMKYFFYIFYPAHLVILYGISMII